MTFHNRNTWWTLPYHKLLYLFSCQWKLRSTGYQHVSIVTWPQESGHLTWLTTKDASVIWILVHNYMVVFITGHCTHLNPWNQDTSHCMGPINPSIVRSYNKAILTVILIMLTKQTGGSVTGTVECYSHGQEGLQVVGSVLSKMAAIETIDNADMAQHVFTTLHTNQTVSVTITSWLAGQ